MAKFKQFISSQASIAISFTLAAGLLLFGSVGGARAALTYYSETYSSQVEMHDIGVSLVENGQIISNRDYMDQVADGTWDEHKGILLAGMLPANEDTIRFGKEYKEELAVQNTGNIDSYVRVTIYKYWVDDQGYKVRDMDPDLINLKLTNLAQDGGCWIVDDSATTMERTVLYYNKVLPTGGTTPILSTAVTIDGDISNHITTNTWVDADGWTHIYQYYDYNGNEFLLEATVDSVQDHNAEAAILSAWGKSVKVNSGTLSLK